MQLQGYVWQIFYVRRLWMCLQIVHVNFVHSLYANSYWILKLETMKHFGVLNMKVMYDINFPCTEIMNMSINCVWIVVKSEIRKYFCVLKFQGCILLSNEAQAKINICVWWLDIPLCFKLITVITVDNTKYVCVFWPY